MIVDVLAMGSRLVPVHVDNPNPVEQIGVELTNCSYQTSHHIENTFQSLGF